MFQFCDESCSNKLRKYGLGPRKILVTVDSGPLVCSETSAVNYHTTLRNNPEEPRTWLPTSLPLNPTLQPTAN